jgi:presenilin-like A22 family membrane protease
MKLSIRHFITFSFWFELFLFIFTQYLAIGVALGLSRKYPIVSKTQAVTPAWLFILMVLIATVILVLILKFVKKPHLVQALYYLAILDGLWIFGNAYFDRLNTLYFLISLVVFYLIYQNVLMHNILIVIAIGAIGAVFGANLMPSEVIIILIFLALYDFIAVYKTKHMVSMFRSLIEKRVYLSLIIPQNFKGIFKKIKEASPQTEFMFLGTGDLAIPAIFITACLKISLLTSLLVGLGSVFGFILLYVLFVSQKERQPMPGLPPLILGCLIGYLISFLI